METVLQRSVREMLSTQREWFSAESSQEVQGNRDREAALDVTTWKARVYKAAQLEGDGDTQQTS